MKIHKKWPEKTHWACRGLWFWRHCVVGRYERQLDIWNEHSFRESRISHFFEVSNCICTPRRSMSWSEMYTMSRTSQESAEPVRLQNVQRACNVLFLGEGDMLSAKPLSLREKKDTHVCVFLSCLLSVPSNLKIEFWGILDVLEKQCMWILDISSALDLPLIHDQRKTLVSNDFEIMVGTRLKEISFFFDVVSL